MEMHPFFVQKTVSSPSLFTSRTPPAGSDISFQRAAERLMWKKSVSGCPTARMYLPHAGRGRACASLRFTIRPSNVCTIARSLDQVASTSPETDRLDIREISSDVR